MFDVTVFGDYWLGMTVERPNTIAGLQAKRAELIKLRARLHSEVKKITCDIDHLDATIRLFDPEADLERVRLNTYATKHRAFKGHMQGFVLGMIRKSGGELSSRQITQAWIEDRGLRPDEATFQILRKRVGACLTKNTATGVLESRPAEGENGAIKLYRLARTPIGSE